MRHRSPARGYPTIVAVLTVCGLATGAANAQVQSLARSGDAAPGLPAGITQNRLVNTATGSFLAPPIVASTSGEVFFTSEIAGPGITTGNRNTIWAQFPGGAAPATQLLARTMNAAPGAGSGVIYASLSAPFINEVGHAAIVGSVAGTGVTSQNDSAVWSRTGLGVQLTAREGSPAFGLTDGAVHSDFRDLLLADESGPVKLAFGSILRGPNVNGSNNFAVGGALLSNWDAPTPVLDVRLGQFAPGATDGRFMTIKRQMGPGGKSGYACSLFGTGITTANGHGNWTDRTGALTLVARASHPAPGSVSGAVFSTVHTATDLPVVNRDGAIAFYGRISGDGVSWTNDTGIWSDRGGTLQAVFVAGAPVSGYPAGVTYSSFGASSTPMVIHDSGAVTVSALLRGTGISGGTNDRALIRNHNGQTTIIAASDAGAPGLPAGVRLSAGALAQVMRANGRGDLFFPAGLQGSGVDPSNDWAMFAYQNGQLRAVCREGQVIDGWTVINLRWDKLQVNDAGQAVFAVNGVWSGDSLGLTRTVLMSVDSAGTCRVVAGESAPLSIAGSAPAVVQSMAISNTHALSNDGRIIFAARFNSATTDEAVLAAQINDGTPPPPACRADYDHSGAVTVADIVAFLTDWFTGSGDYNSDSLTDNADIYAFLIDWFAGCPD